MLIQDDIVDSSALSNRWEARTMHEMHTDEELLDMMILGATWVHQATKATAPGWVGNSLLQVFQRIGALSRTQYRAVSDKPSLALRKLVVSQAVMIWPDERRRASVKIRKSEGLLAVLVNEPIFFSDKIFRPRGYCVFATPTGKNHAQAVAGKYREFPRDIFLGQWSSHRRQMSRLHIGARMVGGDV